MAAILAINDLEGKIVSLKSVQTTYMVLAIDEQLIRVDFFGKNEFNFKSREAGEFSYWEEHPLLLDDNENSVTLYINSRPYDPVHLANDIKEAIHSATRGFRNWLHYVVIKSINFSSENFLSNIAAGRGILLTAPFSVAREVMNVCHLHGASVSSPGGGVRQHKYRLIMFVGNYVIARAFSLHQ